MTLFINDYSEGCHPRILEALTRTNLEQLPGYGADHYCAEAAEKRRGGRPSPGSEGHSGRLGPISPRPFRTISLSHAAITIPREEGGNHGREHRDAAGSG